jgi:nucleoside-diphosphate kinase
MVDAEFEQTLVLIKPDALKNSLTGYVMSYLSEFHTGLRFAGLKVVHVSRMLATQHYAEHVGKPFFPALLDYIMGKVHYSSDQSLQRVIAIVYQGPGAVGKTRQIAGPTNPHNAREEKPGCVRSLGTVVPIRDTSGLPVGQRMDNLIHASATDEEAEREIKLWFRPNDIPPLMQAYPVERCKDHFYYLDGELHTTHVADSVCLLAPGDVVWKTDLQALRKIDAGKKAPCPLDAVAAKYLINEVPE